MSHHILVVDDDPDIREVIGQTLAQAHCTVVTAASGAEAVDCVAQSPPELVLLDLRMPGMDGWSLLRWLQAAAVEAPVVVMSGDAQARAEAQRQGAAGSLAKPFDGEELVALVHRYGVQSEP